MDHSPREYGTINNNAYNVIEEQTVSVAPTAADVAHHLSI
jgi:hypothetical protein